MNANFDEPDITQLQDYYPWYQSENLDLLVYAGLVASPDQVFAISKLFFPDFVVYKGAVILKIHFNVDTFETWHKKFNENHRDTEAFLNQVEVASTLLLYPMKTQNYHNIAYLGNKLKQSWEWELNRQFPKKKFEVRGRKHSDYDDFIISFWQK